MPEHNQTVDLPQPPRHLIALKEIAPSERPYALLDRICHDMLKSALPPELTMGLLANRGLVVVIKPVDASWVYPLEETLRLLYPQAYVLARRGTEDNGSTKKGVVIDLLPHLHGGSVIGISQDPDALLPPLLLSNVDYRLELGRPSRTIIESQIIEITATVPRALKQVDIDSLSAPDLIAALRPARSGSTIARRIAGIAAQKRKPANVPDAEPIEALALSGEVEVWAQDVVRALKSGDVTGLEPTLISGQPGVGKTMLMRSLAATASVPLFATDAAQWHVSGKGHLNDVLAEVERFFSVLQASAPCVAALDELDSVPNRATLGGAYDPWWISLTNAILTQIDRLVSSGAPVLLVGISNLPERLDAALVRPGRLGRHLVMSLPSNPGQRLKMLKIHLPGDLKEADLSSLLPLLHCQSQAELGQIARAAKNLAQRQQERMAIDHILAVLRPDDHRPQGLRWTVAVHEAGHALMAILMGRVVRSVSILPRPGGIEGTTDVDKDPSGVETLASIEDNVRIRMAGRASDSLIGMGPNSGACEDIARSIAMMSDAYLRFWMSGPPTSLGGTTGGASSEQRRAFVERRIANVLFEVTERLSRHKAALNLLAEALLDRGILSANDIRALLEPLNIVVVLPEGDLEGQL